MENGDKWSKGQIQKSEFLLKIKPMTSQIIVGGIEILGKLSDLLGS